MATLLAAISVLGWGAANAAAVVPQGAQELVEFAYHVSNASPASMAPGITYTGGTLAGGGGSVSVRAGVLHGIVFGNVNPAAFGWDVVAAGSAPLTATVQDWRYVNSPTVTGTAEIPSGSSMTVTDVETGKTITLKNGAFSIPTELSALGTAPPSTGNALVSCHGGASSCQAKVSFAGGAHHRKIVIRLTRTNLSLRSVKVASSNRHAAYRLAGGHFILGGSEYVVSLNATPSSPAGSHLILTFRDQATAAGRVLHSDARANTALSPSTGQLVEYDYQVSDAAAGSSIFPNVFYTGGVVVDGGSGLGDQTFLIQSGAVAEADFFANAWDLVPTGRTPLTAELFDRRFVNSGTVTGTVGVPGGSSMTVTPYPQGQPVTLKNGAFSLPTGVSALGARPPAPGRGELIECRGAAHSCRTRIDFAGGAHNRKLVIRLTNINLSLRSVKSVSSSKHPRYRLTDGHFILSGSRYVVTLNAARSSPPGSHLILTFSAKA